MQNTIEIVIKPKHFRLATKFDNSGSCPLTLALQDHFKNKNWSAYGYNSVKFLDENCSHIYYKIVDSWYNFTPGYRNGTDETVDSLIKKAKQKQKVGNYIIIIEKY